MENFSCDKNSWNPTNDGARKNIKINLLQKIDLDCDHMLSIHLRKMLAQHSTDVT